ncbi:DUF2514 family protein [Alcaligenaceae bacterium 429]|nr:DUF2514 family protein [Alcaligenaceae bacterium 429]
MPIKSGLTGAAIAAAIFLSGWWVQGWRYEARLSDLKAQHSLELAARMTDVAHAEALARQIEHELTEAMEIRDRETQEQLEQIAITERSTADQRVRDAAKEYAARYRRDVALATAAAEREAADTAIRMFTELLGELDGLAEIYAAEADRRRVAGLACEASYDGSRRVR